MPDYHTLVASLYEEHFGELSRFLTHHVGCRELAADLLHELFLRLLSNEQATADLRHPRGFLFRCARQQKGDLVKLLGARHPELTAADMAYCVEVILGAITASLAAGGRAEFRRFGVFYLYRSRERKSRNPKSGAAVLVPSRGYIRFRSTMQPILLTAAIDGRTAVAPLSRRHEPTCMEA